MKAAQQNLVLYLLCVASIVWAAPTHSILSPQQTSKKSAFCLTACKTKAKSQPQKDSLLLLDGSSRLLMW